ncbi:MAG: monovalent cation/H(+) antiporter subunit G [Tyzzerella sp.]|nr:monovalent cation/H(+) antiporter subunit G [Tyzzerella sp.]
MRLIEWAQFIVGTGLLITGLGIFFIQLLGVFKFKYILNRMHAAAMGDTLGIGISLVGLMILTGFNFTTLKMGLIIVFLWLASPVSSHLIARLEVTTNEHLKEFCELPEDTKEEEEQC